MSKYKFYKNKNGGKLQNQALSPKGRTPSRDIKSDNMSDGKKNG